MGGIRDFIWDLAEAHPKTKSRKIYSKTCSAEMKKKDPIRRMSEIYRHATNTDHSACKIRLLCIITLGTHREMLTVSIILTAQRNSTAGVRVPHPDYL